MEWLSAVPWLHSRTLSTAGIITIFHRPTSGTRADPRASVRVLGWCQSVASPDLARCQDHHDGCREQRPRCGCAVSVMCSRMPRDGMSWRVRKSPAIAGACRRHAGPGFTIQHPSGTTNRVISTRRHPGCCARFRAAAQAGQVDRSWVEVGFSEQVIKSWHRFGRVRGLVG